MPSTLLYDKDIIVAPTSPLGGAVVMLRVSGEGCSNSIKGIFKTKRGETPSLHPRHVYFGDLYDGDKPLDEVTLVYYQAPASYTGEDTIEITCHASPYIVSRLMQLLFQKGARMAKPGEFTFRSYLNGKLDMAEAEAVADIIAAESEAQLNVALTQLRGELSLELGTIRKKLIEFSSLLELELDFSEEDVEFADRSALTSLCQNLITHINRLVDSFETGRKIKQGVQTALVGIPNSGKSSLLNLLLGENRAIVSNIAGTTRDAISATANVGGVPFRFIDTAGLRQTKDPIEQMGVEKSIEYLEKSDLVLFVIDAVSLQSIPLEQQLASIPVSSRCKDTLFLLNKVDLISQELQEQLLLEVKSQTKGEVLSLSVKQRTGIEELQKALVHRTGYKSVSAETLITNARHLRLLEEALLSLKRLDKGLKEGLSSDLLSGDLRDAIRTLGEITGDAITSEEVLHHIFAHFCIGK